MNASPKTLWDSCLQLIKENVTEQQFDTWFRPIVLQSYKPASKTLLVQVPSQFVYEYLEGHYVDLLRKVLTRVFGQGVQLTYRVMVDQEITITRLRTGHHRGRGFTTPYRTG